MTELSQQTMQTFVFEDCGYWIDGEYLEAWNDVDNFIQCTCHSIEDTLLYSLDSIGVIEQDDGGNIKSYYFDMEIQQLTELCVLHNVRVLIMPNEWND